MILHVYIPSLRAARLVMVNMCPPVVTVRRQGSQQIWQNSVNPGLNRFKGGINGRIICNVPLMGFNENHHFNII